jgi:DHA2 family multidrug resistance protein
MSHLTLASGQGDIIATIMIQGVGFACLFVPLTTVALSNVPRHQMADATGLNSVLRQFGGAVGLAGFATLLDRYATQARAAIGRHVTEVDPLVQQRVASTVHALVARGVAPDAAHRGAIASLSSAVRTQAQVVAFDRIFLLAGILFLFVMPLLILLKGESASGKKAEVHLE